MLALTKTSFLAVKAQTSLAPLSRFRGSRVTTAHAPPMLYISELWRRLCRREWNWLWNWRCVNQHSWDPWQRTTWSRRVTSDFNSVLAGILEGGLTLSQVESWVYRANGGSTRGTTGAPPPPLLKLDQAIFVFQFCIRMLQNKAQMARRIKHLKSSSFHFQGPGGTFSKPAQIQLPW